MLIAAPEFGAFLPFRSALALDIRGRYCMVVGKHRDHVLAAMLLFATRGAVIPACHIRMHRRNGGGSEKEGHQENERKCLHFPLGIPRERTLYNIFPESKKMG